MYPSISLRSPADVIMAVPSLLGFHPHDSLVLLFLSPDTDSLQCTVRIDLDTPQHEALRVVHDLTGRLGSQRLLLIVYPPSLAAWIDSAAEDALLELDRTLAETDIRVTDALIVCEGRWWSLLCTDPDCCPIGGQPVPTEIPDLEVELVASGHLAPAQCRDEVKSRYVAAPDPAITDDLLDDTADRLPDNLSERCDLALTDLVHLATAPTSAHRAELGLLLQDVDVRDWVLVHLCTSDPDLEGVEALTQLALSAPEGLRPRLAGAAAAALHAAAGSPVGVWALIEEAGTDSLARLVAMALESCLPPARLRESFQDALPRLEQRLREQARA